MNEWISVEDRLPSKKMDGFQVIICQEGIVDTAIWINGEFVNFLSEIEYENASHWMPLPPKPTI